MTFALSARARKSFPLLAGLLLLSAVVHTLWATSLDSFTIDEPYHITAGATYLRWHDFRINPEHPPLVKLVVALAEPASVLHVPWFDKLEDKSQERVYTQTAVYKLSDYHRVQRHARFAMIAFNTLLLGLVTVALRRVFSPAVALGALLLLALDPTVSAHMPVVMTDLPLALLGTLACALAVLALRCRRWRDWIAFGVSAGLLMATKHSAPLILLPLLCGCAAVLAYQAIRHLKGDAPMQAVKLFAAAVIGLAVLWSTYGFHYYESRDRDAAGKQVDTFNRTLELKISDLKSPLFRRSLSAINKAHLLPRAYTWGLADTLRAGVEGRPSFIRSFGHDYIDKAPWYVAMQFLIVKVPLPSLALAIGGLALLALRKLPSTIWRPMWLFAAMLVFFLAFISKNGIYYAGVRHWLFAVPLLGVAGGACIDFLLRQKQAWIRWVPAVAILLIAVPVLPQRRIWEYHNALAGGSGGAWKGFENESVDLGQRSDEIIAFCKSHMDGKEPMYGYWTMDEQLEAVGLKRWKPTPEQVGDGHLSGWFLIRAPWLPGMNWKHVEAMRDVPPDARIGNVFFYHRTFYMPFVAGGVLVGEGMKQLHEKGGDKVKAEMYLKRGVMLNPEATSAFVELGNFALQRKEKEEALRLYRAALDSEKYSEQIRQDIRTHIAKVESHPVGEVAPMRIGAE